MGGEKIDYWLIEKNKRLLINWKKKSGLLNKYFYGIYNRHMHMHVCMYWKAFFFFFAENSPTWVEEYATGFKIDDLFKFIV